MSDRGTYRAICGVISVAIAGTAGAQEFSLEDVLFADVPSVFSASRYEQKVTDAPSSVSILTAEEIAANGYRTLGEALSSLPGIFTWDDQNYTYIAFRGFGRPGDYNARVLFLVDGIPMNENVYGASGTGYDFVIDLEIVERIEVVRGPSSSLYGTGAFFGVVNVITRRGRTAPELEIAGELAGQETRSAQVTLGRRFERGPEVLAFARVFGSEGRERIYFEEFDLPGKSDGMALGLDAESFRKGFVKIGQGDLTLQLLASEREKDVPTASYGTVFSEATSTRDARMNAALRFSHNASHTFSIDSYVSWGGMEYSGDYVYDWAEEGEDPYLVVNRDEVEGRWWSADLQLEQRASNHRLVFGANYQNDYRRSQYNADQDVETYVNLDEDHGSSLWAAFIQDEVRFSEAVSVTVGFRHDRYETFGGVTNPRFAVVVDPGERTTVKALYGEAFRAPNAFELYYHDGGNTTKAAMDLRPERIRTSEIVVERTLGSRSFASVAAYDYRTRDLLNLVTDEEDGLLVFRNVERVEARGLEVAVDAGWGSGWSLRTSYALQETENQATGRSLSNSPTHLGRVGVIAPLPSLRGAASIEARAMSDRRTIRGTTAEGHVIFHAGVRSELPLQGLRIRAHVYNIFDEEYEDPAGEEHLQDTLTQPGRTARLQLEYSF